MKKLFILFVGSLIIVTFITGCGQTRPTEVKESSEITFWLPLVDSVSYSYKNFGDSELAKELEKATGVKVKYIHPTKGQEKEQFNLMIASKDLTDIIQQDPTGYKGGAVQAIKDQILMPLNEYINEKYSPNITKLIKEDNEIGRAMQLDDNTYFAFPSISRNTSFRAFQGPIVRKDWLDKLGLPIPETVAEWEVALTEFKEKIGADAPFTVLGTNNFADAFNTPRGYYYDVRKQQVTFGFLESDYKKYVELMHKWYEKGLLDKEFATQSGVMVDAKITNGEVGLFITSVGGGMGKYITTMSSDPSVKWAGAPYPVEQKGTKPLYGQKVSKASPLYSISTKCSNPEVAVKYLDYGYSEGGHMLYNFGIKGISYEIQDGYPKYTKLITDNENKTPMVYEMGKYMASAYGGPFESDARSYEQYLKTDEQTHAAKIWTQAANSNGLPYLILTKEESESIATILTDIQTYWVEGEYKFIMGKLPMSQYDDYVARLNTMGINKVLDVYNEAYKRRISR